MIILPFATELFFAEEESGGGLFSGIYALRPVSQERKLAGKKREKELKERRKNSNQKSESRPVGQIVGGLIGVIATVAISVEMYVTGNLHGLVLFGICISSFLGILLSIYKDFKPQELIEPTALFVGIPLAATSLPELGYGEMGLYSALGGIALVTYQRLRSEAPLPELKEANAA